ncbi:Proteophosphoglycan ppg4 [Rhodotorula toruloides ATCC 204091]|uniref:Proteophosphoglycan ppg4 n=1 Tax=Rhodotorula toruloides TaxID=5286 RepID=A0A0K3CB88_RHOTO|nr:Proteophosphoglycan ppg4 [Rhodotorula toruloides ATCC 204091]KAK4336100.1 Proteophosphoglycan ppg4 [Rhodotorula toruloides]PRQ75830.1 Proteophosphoglycan ppg4 [Rhodotorula toruloides]
MADSSYGTDGGLPADWLAAADDSFTDQSFDPSLDDFLAQDSMGHAQGTAMGLQGGMGGAGVDLGFDGGSLAAFEGAAGSSGTSSYGRSDAGSSPYNVSNYSFSSTVTGNTSAGQDVDAVFGHSPPFSFGADLSNLACDFDTSALQSLFGEPVTQQGGAQTGASFLSPSSAFSPPSNGISPATTTSPSYSIPTVSLSQPSDAPVFALDHAQPAFSSAGSFSSQPRVSVDFGSPSSLPSSSSPPSLYPSLTAIKQQVQQAQRPLSSLAATAGVSIPPIQPTSAPRAGTSFSVQQDPATLAVLAQHAQGRTIVNRQQQQPVPVPASLPVPPQPVQAQQKPGRSASPMDVIVNAGLQNNVHQAPPLQLLSHVSFDRPAASQRGASGKGGRRGANAQEPQDEGEEKGGKGGATGKKGGKKSERGHNAVEQKYRNSINNALATLRDTIPALRHLKPLPSMPTSRRRASQFTLASAAVPETPEGLIDGVPAAKTLSKGIILTKAIEYIDFLRSTRDGLNDDIELLKGMVRSMVGGGEGLVEEWERRRAENEKEREEARRRQREEDEEAEDGTGEDEEEEEEVVAPPAKGRKAAATATAGTKRGRNADGPAASKKAKSAASSGLAPPLTSEYSRVQALNAAHIESLAQQQQAGLTGQHTFPPSPVSSGDELAVSPAALQNGQSGNGGRVLLASFMGASFAGGIGYDLATTAAVAEETVGAWAGGLVRRSVPTDPSAPAAAVDHVHPSLLSGLATLGAASILVALAYLLYPLFFASSSQPALPPRTRRRAQAVAALSALSSAASSSSTPLTVGAARKSALDARRELLRFVGAPRAVALPFSIAKEALVWAIRRATGLTWGRDDGHEDVEEAVAWVRIAEIEASVGGRLPYLSRCYTFLRLSNLSRSPSWPSVTPTTSRAAIDGLIAIQLLALGHIGGAKKTWSRMLDRQKKRESTGTSFVDIALNHDFETVQLLLSPSTRVKDDADLAEPSDTVPLLALAEATCQDALEEVWRQVLVVVSESTTSAPSLTAAAAVAELEDTLDLIYRTTVDGSEVHALASMTKVFLACYRAGLSAKAGVDLSQARELLARLALETKREGPFARLACASPFFQLLAPAVSNGIDFSTFLPKSPPTEATSDVDLLATVVLSWLLVRRQAAASSSKAQPDAALHARALAIRRMLGQDSLKSQPTTDDDSSDDEDAMDEQAVFQDAKDSLIDALATVARKAAGLKTAQDEDSGVELEAEAV